MQSTQIKAHSKARFFCFGIIPNSRTTTTKKQSSFCETLIILLIALKRKIADEEKSSETMQNALAKTLVTIDQIQTLLFSETKQKSSAHK